MTVFTGGNGNDNANAITGTLIGFTGGTVADLQDGIGDLFNGGLGNDAITTGNGSDTINGGDGDDFIAGRGGADSINGGIGFDTVSYQYSSTGVVVDLGAGTATDGTGANDILVVNTLEVVRGSAQADSLTGSNRTDDFEHFQGLAGNDVINGSGGFDEVRYDADASFGGTAGVTVNLALGTAIDGFGNTDTLSNIEGVRGTAAADNVTGSAGNNEFRTLGGADIINGGDGFDTARYDSDFGAGGTSGVSINLATGFGVDGFGTVDTLTSIEAVRGTRVADYFLGNGVYNTFVGGQGADYMDGGQGYDRVNYWSGSEAGGFGVVVNLATGVATDTYGNTDTLVNIEWAEGSSGADSLTGSNRGEEFTGNDGNDTFVGGGGADFMNGGRGIDRYDGSFGVGDHRDQSSGDQDTASFNNTGSSGVTQGAVVNLDTGNAVDGFGNAEVLIDIERLRGTSLADQFTGSSTANLLQERFQGLGGADTINGGAGFDVISHSADAGNGGGAGVTVNLATGTAIDGFGATDQLTGIDGVIGTAFADTLTGNAGNNFFRGLGGADVINGGDGRDTLQIDQVDDLIGGTGATINVAAGNGTNFDGSVFTFTSIEHFDGSFRNDTMLGSTGNENFSGIYGNDSMDGSDGDDTLNGGSGADTLIGGAGNDWLVYVFNTTGVVQNGIDADANAAFGYTSQNWNWTGVNVNLATGVMSGLDGAVDTISGFENIAGTFLNDTLTGDGAANGFRGYAGNDTIDGGAGSDTVFYSATYSVTAGIALAGIVGDLANGINVNLVTGAAADGQGGTDTLSNIENIIGSIGNDTVLGNGDDNRFTGGQGNDSFDGGAGSDTVVFARTWSRISGVLLDTTLTDTPGNVTVNLAAGTATDGVGGSDTFSNVENATTADGNDTLSGNTDGNALLSGDGNDLLVGLAGADTLNGGAGIDTASYASSTNAVVAELWRADINTGIVFATDGTGAFDQLIGIEHVVGGSAGDLISGDSAGNEISGGSGNDTLNGGFGDDTLSGGADADYLFGAVGADSINGGIGNDTVFGGDVGFSANDGADSVLGDAGDDFLIGEGGNDTLDGGADADYLVGGYFGIGVSGDDSLLGGAGNDTLLGEDGNDTLDGGTEDDFIVGGIGNDSIRGGDGGDFIVSDGFGTESGNDTINGGIGNDTMLGGRGDDTLTGDAGADLFWVSLTNGQSSGVDTITDYDLLNDAVIIDAINPGSLTFAALQGLMTQTGAHVTIDFSSLGHPTTSLVIQNVTIAQLQANDFIIF